MSYACRSTLMRVRYIRVAALHRVSRQKSDPSRGRARPCLASIDWNDQTRTGFLHLISLVATTSSMASLTARPHDRTLNLRRIRGRGWGSQPVKRLRTTFVSRVAAVAPPLSCMLSNRFARVDGVRGRIWPEQGAPLEMRGRRSKTLERRDQAYYRIYMA